MSGSLLYKKDFWINDKIRIVIPTVGDVIDSEDTENDYYAMVSLLTSMPIDMMVQLDDIGIDFSKINEYELFLLLFNSLKIHNTSMIFGDLDLSKFELATNEQNGMVVLIDAENDIVIDREIHNKIAESLRKINHLTKNTKKPGNEEARLFMLDRARKKQRRKRKSDSQLEQLIVAMVNTEQFKYNFDSTRLLSIFQFNESVRQVIKKVEYDNRMFGVYSGTISSKDLSQDDLNWLIHK